MFHELITVIHITKSTPKISRYNLDDKKSEGVTGADDPGDSTYLAVYYDTPKIYHHLLYQKQRISEQNKNFDLQDGKSAVRGSPICVLPLHFSLCLLACVYIASFHFSSDSCTLEIICSFFVLPG